MFGRSTTTIPTSETEYGPVASAGAADATASGRPRGTGLVAPRGRGGDPGLVPADVGARVEAVASAELGGAVSVLAVEPYAGGAPVFEVQVEREDGERVTLYVDKSLAIIGLDTR